MNLHFDTGCVQNILSHLWEFQFRTLREARDYVYDDLHATWKPLLAQEGMFEASLQEAWVRYESGEHT